MADTFGRYCNRYRDHISMVVIVWGSPLNQILCQIWKIFRLFLNICVKFQAFKNLYLHKNQRNMGIFEKNWRKKFHLWGKKNSALILMPKLDRGFSSKILIPLFAVNHFRLQMMARKGKYNWTKSCQNTPLWTVGICSITSWMLTYSCSLTMKISVKKR